MKMLRFTFTCLARVAGAAFLLSAVFIPASLIAFQKGQALGSLDYGNPALDSLRKEIFANLQHSRNPKKQLAPVKFYRYRVKDKDNFFTIMARTGQNPDTLASVNNLASYADLHSGQWLNIPNYRGILYQTDKNITAAGLSRQSGVPLQSIVSLNGLAGGATVIKKGTRLFLPGIRMSKDERAYFKGRKFIHPLPVARVSSRYGMRRHPFTHKRMFHKGIDLAAPSGSPVKASAGGRVIFAGHKGTYGRLVIIEHKHGYRTYYGHLKRIRVRRGQRVAQGKIIGLVGQSGRATGPHLHFELRKGHKVTSPHRAVAVRR